ncbi:lipoyl domain-containing protein [Rhizorhapis sp. SPR117]|uniref:lipoyl domain-containing protein n=1 Tax=Rhizorhapis sp. SPR117 TaxID=2912611 RepID=UPI001F25EF77|nr:lipoyl domain-containing protein [Rhizorhapis sp. SPR117]
MTDILIPKLSMTMTEVTLAEWLVEDGAIVAIGQDIYALETDKSTLEIQSDTAGTLRVIEHAGQIYPIGKLIGRIE